MENLLFVSGEEGDWSGMYLNGVLVKEGHKITKYDVVDALKHYNGDLGDGYGDYTINQDYLKDNGLPLYFKDINKEMISQNT